MTAGPKIELEGLADWHVLPTLCVPNSELGQPLHITFEAVADRLRSEAGVFWEPDGSFVWTVQHPQVARLEGQVADGSKSLQHIELFGSLTESMLDRLLELVRSVEVAQPVMFQLIRQGVFVDETSLRQLLS